MANSIVVEELKTGNKSFVQADNYRNSSVDKAGFTKFEFFLNKRKVGITWLEKGKYLVYHSSIEFENMLPQKNNYTKENNIEAIET